MRGKNQKQLEYHVGPKSITITTANHPKTFEPMYAVNIRDTEQGFNQLEVGVGNLRTAQVDLLESVDLPPTDTILFPISGVDADEDTYDNEEENT
jgi:hypothetical protein